MTKIILLSGKQGAGKTSVSNEIMKRYFRRKDQWACFQLNFADTIYLMHDRVLNVLKECGIERPGLVKDGPLLQLLGTDWGRKYLGDNIWVETLKGRIDRQIKIENDQGFKRDCLVIVADCRFKNEFSAFPEALRVRLVCPDDVRKQRCEMWRENTQHPSEVDLDFFEENGLFDLSLDTANTPLMGCVDLVLAQIDKNTWMEKR